MPKDGSPNACFAYLQEIGYAVTYSAEHLPQALVGQSRRDAMPAAGPFGCGPSASEKRLAALTTARAALAAEYSVYEQPDNAFDAGARLGDLLTTVTRRWYHDFVQASYRFEDVERPQDRWIDVLCKLPSDYESWTARVFILWGRHILPDLIAELFDAEAEAYLDGEFADLVNEFDEYHLEERLRKMDHLLRQAMRRPKLRSRIGQSVLHKRMRDPGRSPNLRLCDFLTGRNSGKMILGVWDGKICRLIRMCL